MQPQRFRTCAGLFMAVAVVSLVPGRVLAHCDSLVGPVVQDARLGLEKGDPTPVLKWVNKEHEGEIRDAFKQTMAVREKGDDAKALADRYFFEDTRAHTPGRRARSIYGVETSQQCRPWHRGSRQRLCSLAQRRSWLNTCSPLSPRAYKSASRSRLNERSMQQTVLRQAENMLRRMFTTSTSWRASTGLPPMGLHVCIMNRMPMRMILHEEGEGQRALGLRRIYRARPRPVLIPCHSSPPTCMIDMPQLQQYVPFSRKQGCLKSLFPKYLPVG